MNFFFALQNKELKSKITIPKFQNRQKTNSNYNLYSAEIVNDIWKINNVICRNDSSFYYVDETDSNNHKIYFLAKPNEVKRIEDIKYKLLLDLNNFTNTEPAFRSNLRVFNKQGGFSSYQSEYPYSMITKKGSILSSVNAIANKDAEINKLFIRNIYEKPIKEKFYIFFIDIELKKIVLRKKIITNFTNEIEIKKNYINPNIYIFTKSYVGIPIFLSMKKNHISIEHTHPPHLYIFSEDKFKRISDLKKEINEIIT